jgi:hypothetical protein
MSYQALATSNKYELKYVEGTVVGAEYNSHDFVIFNWHHATTPFFTQQIVRAIQVPKFTIVTECTPADPLANTKKWFDGYLVLDPTVSDGEKIWGMPRPLDEYTPREKTENLIPVIGSFGFDTPGKQFDVVLKTVYEEFDEAIVRFHIPAASYVPHIPDPSQGETVAYLQQIYNENCNLKPGIKLELSHDYKSKRELIDWCFKNDLNAFLYKRNMSGLAAVTDQAISAQKPIIVSDCNTFRHIHTYMKNYPSVTFTQAMSDQESVMRMYRNWHPKHFSRKFERILNNV